MSHIADCVEGWDVEGEGDTLDEALAAIAVECESTADRLALDVVALRVAAARYRGMRTAASLPVVDAEFDAPLGGKIPGYTEEHRDDGSLSPVARFPLSVLDGEGG